MKIFRITETDSPRLLIFFSGWAMDERPLLSLAIPGWDVWVAHAYACIGDIPPVGQRTEIAVVAWSFGIVEASRFIAANPHLPITVRIAINTSPTPIDDKLGIPRTIFNGTLDGLTPRTLQKFYRRVCGSAENFAAFSANAPQPDFELLAPELRLIDSLAAESSGETVSSIWDVVYISSADRIIPTENQLRAWSGHPDIRIIPDAPHLPDFSQILSQCLIDKTAVGNKFSKAASTYDANCTVQRIVASELFSRWKQVQDIPSASYIAEIGAGTGILTNIYSPLLSNKCSLSLYDLSPLEPSLPGTHIQADAEVALRHLPDNSLDAIVSSSAIQWMNSPVSFVRMCIGKVRQGGIVAIATYAPGTMAELGITPPAHYLSCEAWEKALRTTSATSVNVSQHTHTLSFGTSLQLLRHLRLTGTNATSATESTAKALAIIRQRITTLTFHPLYLIIRK